MKNQASLGRDSSLAFLATGTQGAARFVTSWLVGRLGGVLALGTMMSGFATAQLLAILGPMPAGTAASKFGSAEKASSGSDSKYIGATFHVAVRVLQVLPLLCVISVVIAVFGYGTPFFESLCVAASLVGISAAALGKGILYGQRRIPLATSVELLLAAASVAGLLVLLLMGVRGLYLLLPLAIAQLIFLPVILAFVERSRAAKEIRVEIDRFILYGAVGSLASAGFLHLTLICVRIIGGGDEAGFFSGAVAVSSPILMVTSTFSLVFYPRLSQSWASKDLESYRNITDRFTRTIAALVFFPLAMLLVFSAEFSLLVWGSEFTETGRLLPFIVMAVLFKGLTAVAVASLTAGPKWGMKLSARSSVVGAVVGLSLVLPLSMEFDATGGAIGYLVGSLIVAIVPFVAVWKHGKYAWRSLALRYFAGIVAILIVFYSKTFTGVWVSLFLLIGVSLAVLLPDLKIVSGRNSFFSR